MRVIISSEGLSTYFDYTMKMHYLMRKTYNFLEMITPRLLSLDIQTKCNHKHWDSVSFTPFFVYHLSLLMPQGVSECFPGISMLPSHFNIFKSF